MPRTTSAVRSVSSFVLAFFFFLLAWYFTAADYPNLRRVVRETIPRSLRRIGVQARGAFSAAFGGYLKAEALVSLGVTGILLVGFALLRQPYWVLLAVVLGVMDFIPIIGAGTVMVPWAAVLFALGSWERGLALLAVWGVICLFRRIVEPKVVGNQTGLHPSALPFRHLCGHEDRGPAGHDPGAGPSADAAEPVGRWACSTPPGGT